LGHPPFAAQVALEFIHQAEWQVAYAALPGFCVFGRKVDGVSTEREVLKLDSDELPDPAAQLVDNLHHEFVAVVLNRIEELLPFFYC